MVQKTFDKIPENSTSESTHKKLKADKKLPKLHVESVQSEFLSLKTGTSLIPAVRKNENNRMKLRDETFYSNVTYMQVCRPYAHFYQSPHCDY